MTHIEDYCAVNNITRRTCERYIASGEVKATKLQGRTYILDNDLQNLQKPSTPTEVPHHKARWDLLINKAAHLYQKLQTCGNPGSVGIIGNPTGTLTASEQFELKEQIKSIQNQILKEKEALELKGIIISGYDYKSLRRKITTGKVQRQTRADKFSVKHHILISPQVQFKIMGIANYIYFQNAASNFSLLTDLIIEYAKRNEEHYEVAAIPRSTLYKFLSNQFSQSGYKTVHQFISHQNLFHTALPKVTGAFTRDIKFMDYILGDDNLRDTYSVLVWDARKSEWIKKRARIWLWIEALTMYPLGWTIKVGDFSTRDITLSLSQVFLQYGLPNKAIVVDNGIGRSAEFESYLHKLHISVPSDPTLVKVNSLRALNFSEAYTPTNKSPVERSFGLHKNEFDTFSNNFVGPDKLTEARHRGLALSPEEPLDTFETYKQKLEAYLTGFYIERPRTRTTAEGKIRISIKDYFEKFYKTYSPSPVSNIDLRYALTSEDVIKKFSNNLKFRGYTFMPSVAPPFSFYNKKFKVLYNPLDLSEIDLYAVSDMIDELTGEQIPRGRFVMTLQNAEVSKTKYQDVKSLKQEITKRAKQLARATVAASSTLTESFLPDKVSPNAEILSERKLVEKEVANLITQKIQEINITPDIEPVITELATDEYALHLDEDEEFTTLTEEQS